MMDEKRKKDVERAIDVSYDEEMEKVNTELKKELFIALVGEVNAGKSTTINRILGKDVAKTNPRPGETISIDPYNYEGLEKIKLMDTPGLNDPDDENPKKTLAFIKQADLILFFTNAAGTVFSESEKRQFHDIAEQNENIIIVLNKIDAAEKIDSLCDFIKDQTDHQYIVVPISARTGENIDKLKHTILDALKKRGKELLFAKGMKDKDFVAKRWIVGAGLSAGVIGASPIPGSDVVPITAIQVGLLMKLSSLYGKPLTRKGAKNLIILTATKTLGQSMYRQVVKFIPGAGSIAGGVIASSLTLALGYGVKHAYERNLDIDIDLIETIFTKYRKRKSYKDE